MWRWIAKQYSRRIVNVNVNIVAAGMLAMALAMIPVSLSRRLGVKDEDTFLIALIYGVSDFLLDLVLVIALHWMANHWPRKWKKTQGLVQSAEKLAEHAGPPPLPFLKDTTIIQVQRACLSPLLYGTFGFIFLPLFKNVLLWPRDIASFFAMLGAVLLVRTAHTFWMLADERRWHRRWQKEVAARGLAGASPPTGPAGPGSAGATSNNGRAGTDAAGAVRPESERMATDRP